MYKVKDISLADRGMLKIKWAESRMPVLMKIRDEFERRKPFNGLNISCCLHVTKETAVLVKTLKAGGATVALCGSNPLSTQDDVAAALTEEDINVFAWRDLTKEEYYWCVDQVLNFRPNITLDDGADLISRIHSKRQELLKNVLGGQEETTTGVIRLRAMEKDKALKYPIIAVNDTPTKRMFDNLWGTAQSTLDAIMRTTNIMLAGKNFVVAGFGYCGRGLAIRAKGMGANVIVTETDPVKALEAIMYGFRVMPMNEAAKVGDVFVTVTGNKDVIVREHYTLMKDGSILLNSGHFDVEISVKDLESLAVGKRTIRDNLEEYELENGKKLYLIGRGRLANLVGAEGHPSEVMDLSFSNQALCCEWIIKNYKKLKPKVYEVSEEIDKRVAELKLESLGIKIDKLSKQQKEYLESWKTGT